MKKKTTARDIAAELGVSVKTVTNAYGRPDQLSPALRERVLATAAKLGYAGPDPVAAGLRRGRVGALGVAYGNRLSYAFEDPVSRELLAGITSVVEDAGVGLLLLPGSSQLERRKAAINGAVIDGLVAASLADDDPLLEAAVARHLAVVIVDQPRPRPGIPWVGVDDRAAAAQLAEHVLARGHRRIGVVTFGLWRGPTRGLVDAARQRDSTLAVSRDRLAGYRDAVERHGLRWDEIPVFQGTDSTPAEGEAGAPALLALAPRPSALLCMSDGLAEGAPHAARGAVAIAGFDDASPTAEALGLTTVRQPHRAKGEHAARALLALLRGEQPPAPRLLATELVVRASA